VPSLVDDTGAFWNSSLFYRHALLGRVDWQEAADELDAQIRWAVEQGLRLDNLDTHVHFHMLPPARRLTLELAGRYGVRAWRTPDPRATLLPSKLWVDLLATPSPDTWELMAPHFLLSLHQWGERLLTDPQLAELFRRPGLVTELVVHPGYRDDPHLPLPDQLPPERRQFEVDLLGSAAFAAWLQRTGLRLISFAGLRNATTI
jgi:predicted glycoside hydrolase/deacetylase ChbG (UPF0249 family)